MPIRTSDTLRIHYLDVGSGMCHVIQCPGADGTVIVDDCGSTDTTHAMGKDEARSFIQDVIKGHPLKVVLTHKDADHVNWIPYVLDTLPSGTSLEQVWAAGDYATYPPDVKTWIRDANKDWGANVRIDGFASSPPLRSGWDNDLQPVPELSCGTAESYVLTVNSGSGSNASSLMLRLAYGGRSAILPGDATGAAQNEAIENTTGHADMLVTDLLEMSHHGAASAGSNSEAWAKATRPKYLLASAGVRYGHPRCESVDHYLDAENARVLAAGKHWLDCGKTQGSERREIENAVYTTGTQGTLVGDIVYSGSGVASVALYCGPDGDPCP
ncbi:hypothetical protein [Luteibacter sp.]|uniref:ComEC/Rec2 family competence protein n=1 Tax=Luteibacter sp. TaxID=1886636 RepID=UPI0025C2E902|nr:hypothetical protein [Luteibacter sp.]